MATPWDLRDVIFTLEWEYNRNPRNPEKYQIFNLINFSRILEFLIRLLREFSIIMVKEIRDPRNSCNPRNSYNPRNSVTRFNQYTTVHRTSHSNSILKNISLYLNKKNLFPIFTLSIKLLSCKKLSNVFPTSLKVWIWVSSSRLPMK